ncbi:MAG: hypothetical protein MK363_23630, partial [Pseudomonas sp.]|nr:hypothetical protein [Pseudomonas sp.]
PHRASPKLVQNPEGGFNHAAVWADKVVRPAGSLKIGSRQPPDLVFAHHDCYGHPPAQRSDFPFVK